jgi:hypothetical protein
LVWRPCRTSWLIVGTKTLLLLSDRGAVGPDRGGRSSAAGQPRRAVRSGPVMCVMVAEWSPAQAPKADPSRGHEGGVYRWPGISVKRAGWVAVRRRGPSPRQRAMWPCVTGPAAQSAAAGPAGSERRSGTSCERDRSCAGRALCRIRGPSAPRSAACASPGATSATSAAAAGQNVPRAQLLPPSAPQRPGRASLPGHDVTPARPGHDVTPGHPGVTDRAWGRAAVRPARPPSCSRRRP